MVLFSDYYPIMSLKTIYNSFALYLEIKVTVLNKNKTQSMFESIVTYFVIESDIQTKIQ